MKNILGYHNSTVQVVRDGAEVFEEGETGRLEKLPGLEVEWQEKVEEQMHVEVETQQQEDKWGFAAEALAQMAKPQRVEGAGFFLPRCASEFLKNGAFPPQ
mmetsp:Transcript_5371/g.13092  ORF Transcript_5371/g.13092 Transcript_5371/m.13092 type:complete len:101 (+) Transcript_5371:433-735(+)